MDDKQNRDGNTKEIDFEGVTLTNGAENWKSTWAIMNNGMNVWLYTECRTSRLDEELIDNSKRILLHGAN